MSDRLTVGHLRQILNEFTDKDFVCVQTGPVYPGSPVYAHGVYGIGLSGPAVVFAVADAEAFTLPTIDDPADADA